jgi:hypothetical protein
MDLEIRPIEPSVGVVRVLSPEAGAVELAVVLSPRVAD